MPTGTGASITPAARRENSVAGRSVHIIERNLIRECTSAARSRGRVGGRPPKMTPQKIKQVKLMRDNGMSQLEIAEILGVGRTTLYRHLK
ncbi:helix-turn-helix domain-containing protein [Prescottella defluvii]|nr:helix-turn-helix domain-containing protein [Prescottella defluvii]